MASSSRKLAGIAGAFLVIGASTAAFTYEMDIIEPKRLVKRHQQQMQELRHTIEEQRTKINEMKQRKDELHKIVAKYQHEEQVKEEHEQKLLQKYPILHHGLPDVNVANAASHSSSSSEQVQENASVSSHLFFYDQYISKVDQARKIPLWVANTLSTETLRRRRSSNASTNAATTTQNADEVTRERSVFGPDPNDHMDDIFRASNSDYWHSGYDRGHMVPAGDMRSSQHALNQTFYLNQNIVPQNARNNRGYWRRFETFVRNLPREYGQVHVITGPLFLPKDHDQYLERGRNDLGEETPVKRVLTHEVIGDGQVHVPTHLYKVVLAEKNSPQGNETEKKSLVMSAFLLPNEYIKPEVDLSTYEVPIEELEKRAGFRFFEKARLRPEALDVTSSDRLLELASLCFDSRTKCKMHPEDPSLEYIHEINESKSVDEVKRVWHRMLDEGLKPHDWTKSAYEQKLERLARVQSLNNLNEKRE